MIGDKFVESRIFPGTRTAYGQEPDIWSLEIDP
jgi:hypothetical protein